MSSTISPGPDPFRPQIKPLMAPDEEKKDSRTFARTGSPRPPKHWTQQFKEHGFQEEAPPHDERVSGKGDLTRRRTVHAAGTGSGEDSSFGMHLDVDPATALPRPRAFGLA